MDPNNIIHFGKVDEPLPEWRDEEIISEDWDNDEDEPIEPDVLAILGFDPDKL